MSIIDRTIGHIMTWNIAQAKQQFSEVVRLSAQEPQAIYKRDKPVAMLINADEFEAFQRWHTAQHEASLTEQFAELRLALQEVHVQEMAIPARSTVQRPNAFVQMLEEEGLTSPSGSD